MNQKEKKYWMPKTARHICYIICVLLLTVSFVCVGVLVEDYNSKQSNQKIFSKMAESVVVKGHEEEIFSSNAEFENETHAGELLNAYRALADENPDMVGWIQIDGTTINYPVMHTPDSPNYYLKRNFHKEHSDLGTPFMQGNCQMGISENLLIYGHHMLAGGMFSDLDLYKEESFWKNHKIIRFDTLTELSDYEIFAVFVVDVADTSWFRFHEFTEGDADDYKEYVRHCKQVALYETGIEPMYGEQLITLVTCEYTQENGRIVVVAKKNGGES